MLFKSKHNIEFPDISVYEFIFEGEKEFSQDKLAFVNAEDKSEFITFGELKSLTLRFGASLQRLTDFEKGDVVAIYSPNDIYYAPILHGTAAVGGIVASIDSTCDAETAVTLMQTVSAKYIIAHMDTLERAIQAAKTIGIPFSHVFVLGKSDINGISCVENQFWGNHEELAIPIKYTKEELAATTCYYYFTSGTTNKRKVVIQTQRSMFCAIASKLTWFPAYTNVLAQKYFHHGSSLTFVLHLNVIHRCTTYVTKEDYSSFEKLLATIQDCKIHGFTTQPWVVALLAKDAIADKYDISSLEWVISAGYAADKDMCAEFFKKRGVPCISAFGMTESLSSFDGGASYTLAGQIGTLSPNCSCKIVNENGEEVGYNEVGELLFKGPALTPGYFNNSEANAQSFDNEGFYHTGDLMKADENGVFSYVGRAKDVIRYGEHVIFPQDIERVLMSHSLVVECAIIGVYSQKETCAGFVMLAGNNDGKNLDEVKNEILEIAKTQLTPEKQLHGGLYILEDFPRNSNGKIDRNVLRNHAMNQRVMSLEIKS